VVVVGRLQTRTWDDNEGKRHYVTEVIAEELYFAEGKKSQGMEDIKPAAEIAEPTDGFYPWTMMTNFHSEDHMGNCKAE